MYTSYVTILSGIPWNLVFSGICTSLKASVYTKKIQMTSCNTIIATFVRRMMGRLDVKPWLSCILIGCIFYDMV